MMARFIVWLAAALVSACGGGENSASRLRSDQTNDRIEITGSVQWYTIEGGFWAIQGGDGNVYDPSAPLDAMWQKADFPVRAVLRLRPDLGSTHMAGQIVDVLQIEQLSCQGLPCPAFGPAVTLTVAPGSGAKGSGSFYDATLTNVQRPTSAGVSPAFNCVTNSPTPTAPVMRYCFIFGEVAGVYEADATAPGFDLKHVRIEVPAREIKPYECCAAQYVPQATWVYLSASK